jgi:hypothetical protein
MMGAAMQIIIDTDASGGRSKNASNRKSRARVFSQTMERLSLFQHSQRAEAEKKAAEMSESQKTPHFVMLVKKAVDQ